MLYAVIHTSIGTENELDSEESFQNISVLQEISQWVPCSIGKRLAQLLQASITGLEGITAKGQSERYNRWRWYTYPSHTQRTVY